LLAGAALTVAILLIAAWYAGRESAGLEAQRANAELQQVTQQLASTQLALAQQKAKSGQLEGALSASGKAARLALESKLQAQLLEAQAEANQYKAILDRERDASNINSRLIDTLAQPGARLLPLKGVETAADSTAYTLVVENSRLVLVASKLPEMAQGRQLQLWIVRKHEPKFVSCGVFNPDHDGRVLMSFEEGSVLSDVASIAVTDEPEGGSPVPTGSKLLETLNAAPELSRSP